MTSAAPDLFGLPAIPGLALGPEIVSAAEAAALAAAIDESGLAPFRFQGWLGKRLTASYGWRYDFDDASFRETEAIPGWLQPLRARAAAFAGLAPDELVQVLLTRYDPGATIGWHRDRPVFEHVVGVSIGGEAAMRFRRRSDRGFDRVTVPLAPRSVYHLAGEARHDWEHSIAELPHRRWSITFRSLSAKGRRYLPAS